MESVNKASFCVGQRVNGLGGGGYKFPAQKSLLSGCNCLDVNSEANWWSRLQTKQDITGKKLQWELIIQYFHILQNCADFGVMLTAASHVYTSWCA